MDDVVIASEHAAETVAVVFSGALDRIAREVGGDDEVMLVCARVLLDRLRGVLCLEGMSPDEANDVITAAMSMVADRPCRVRALQAALREVD